MPQLDLITFVDQAVYVYLFFILQYLIVSIFVIPNIYQILAVKRLFYENAISDICVSLKFFINSVFLLSSLESKFEIKFIK